MNNLEFDFENSVSYNIDDSKEAIIVNQKGLNSNNKENYALSFVDNKTDIATFYIIKTINISINIKKVEFYSFSNKLIFSTVYDNNNQTITTTFENGYANKSNQAACYDGSYGQYVADCLEDAYTNHGWISVWATIQTAFIPQTAAALGAACAVDGLTNGNCYTSF